MRVLKSGLTAIPVRASNLARLYFEQAFLTGFDAFLQRACDNSRPANEIYTDILMITWSMHKAEMYACRKSVPDFSEWINGLTGFDLNDCIEDLITEIEAGFCVAETTGSTKTKEMINTEPMAAKMAAIGKKMGLSLEEFNELTTQALLDIMRAYAGGENGGADDGNGIAKGNGNAGKIVERMATPQEAAVYFR